MADTFNSFYGGRKGASFVISKTFPSIETMVKEFKNINKTNVGFGEYVLIRPESAEDVDNGKVYLRGYNYTNDFGGAEYIGQFVGPTGACPNIEVHPFDYIKGIEIPDWASKKTSEEYEIATHPGSDNPNVKIATGIFRDGKDSKTEAHIGFSFPHPVITTNTATLVSPYDENGQINLNNKSTIIQSENPFEYKVNLKIPKGIKGNSLNSINLDTETGRLNYTIKDFSENEKGKISEPIPLPMVKLLKRIYLGSDHILKVDYTAENGRGIETKELGSVLNKETGLIYRNLTLKDLFPGESEELLTTKTVSDIVIALGKKYPKGNFNEEDIPVGSQAGIIDIQGKMLTVEEDTLGKIRGFYAFNYGGATEPERQWYRIGSLGESGAKEVVLGGTEEAARSSLAEGGIWLQEELQEELPIVKNQGSESII